MFEYENSFKNKNIKKQKINNHGAFKYSKHTCCECGSSTNTLYQFLTIYMTNIYFLFWNSMDKELEKQYEIIKNIAIDMNINCNEDIIKKIENDKKK